MKKRVLILDDDRVLLCILQTILNQEGFDVSLAEETGDILELVQQLQPDLLLVDFSLNGTSGGELCLLLKSSQGGKKLPVIIFSAHSNKGLEKGRYGCDEFIAKPFDLAELIEKVNLLINTEMNRPLIQPLLTNELPEHPLQIA